MDIYRIENAKGRGPFISGDMDPRDVHSAGSPEYEAYLAANRLPSPEEDGIDPEGGSSGFGLEGGMGFKSGAASIAALVAWFHGIVAEELSHKGYMLARYDVPEADVYQGKHQVSFRKRNAKLVERVPLPVN